MNGYNSIRFLTLPVSDLSSSIIFPVFSSSVFFSVFSNSSVSVEMVDMERFMSDDWVPSPVEEFGSFCIAISPLSLNAT